MIFDGLHLELRFSINDFRWWAREVGSVLSGFRVRSEKTGVENIMDCP
jgi:hypothetical protein